MIIDQNSIIDRGLQLSKNFLLEHVSSGAFSPSMNQWIPRYSSILIPDSSLLLNLTGSLSMPLWKIVSNLQSGAQGLLEPLLSAFGSDTILQSGFLNNVPFGALANEVEHLTGTSFDIQIKGFENNIYPLVKEIQKLSKSASSMNVVYGSTSWIHLNVDPKRTKVFASNLDLPTVTTTDLVTGFTESGITSIRGFN